MNEQKFRLVSLIFLFLMAFAIQGQASELEAIRAVPMDSEMKQALNLAKEVDALNKGEKMMATRIYHPQVDPMTQGQSVHLSDSKK